MAEETAARRFPWPLAAVVVVLLVALGLTLRSLLTPPLLAAFLLYLLIPYRRSSWVLRVLIGAGIFTLLWVATKFGWLLFVLGTSVFMAYVLDPVVSWLERRRFRRSVAAITVLVPTAAIFVLLLLILIPPLIHEGGEIISSLPEVPAKVEALVNPWLARMGLDPSSFAAGDQMPAILDRVKAIMSRLLDKLIPLLIATGSVLSGLALVPFCTFYLLLDARRIIARGAQVVPPKFHPWFADLGRQMDRLLGHWLRGVGLVALVMGALTFLGLVVLGVPYALTLGVLTALMNVLPVLGFWVTYALAGVVALSAMGLAGLIKVTVLYFVLSAVESQFLQPKLVGKAVGLHPLVTFLALIVFGSMFGIVGAFFAVPLALFLGILGRQLMALYHASDIYQS